MINLVLNFISQIFYQVLYMSIIGIFVGIFILIIQKVLDKNIAPKWKCIIWYLLLISLIIPFKFNIKTVSESNEILSISGLLEPIQEIPNRQENVLKENSENYEKSSEKVIKQNSMLFSKEEIQMDITSIVILMIIPLIWILGLIISILLLVISNINIKLKMKGKIYNNKKLNELINECKESIGIKKNIKIVMQEFKKTPSIIGIINPKILITSEFLNNDKESQKYILMHELAHYKRKDLLFNYICLIITAVHWFNPFIWVYFKKIRQDIEIATDEMVLTKLNSNQKKKYGRVLINSLNTFQEEKYTAKLLSVTDDNSNIERRIKMIKLSEKFSKHKKIITIMSILIIVVGVVVFFTNNQINSEDQANEKVNKEKVEYESKAFEPSFENNYDFTQDMIYNDQIYYRKINNYEEYMEVKTRWNNILEMSESDFQNNFMIITAIENTSMTGLTVDKLETDKDNLYISLIHYEDGIDYNENETCISFKISRKSERENINVTRNLRGDEKDMSEDLQIAESNNSNGKLTYQYRGKEYREMENKLSNNSSIKLIPQDWKDMMARNFFIEKDLPEIDFSNWNNLGNGFYSIAITEFSDYLKLMNNYNAPKLSWYDFEYIYVIMIVRDNKENTILANEIEEENGKSYLNVSTGGLLDVLKDFKYPAISVAVPNYRSLENNFLNVRIK